ncbi:ATP-grasp domain-containing protein [Aquisalimonas asiatica]|uniref:RimK-like ATP-grasp domain-containing protein n=1 Tax=Aquisalimonas asiatica TaxID=406100 RepID=A0A1H8U5I9_9GAMM|nr:hypothetical protein [Aquisalimonas asiatica]SEO98104.1 RimK-like ATP-grasp domain-containing protein [Aquisalimonas asiatica]
MPILHAIEHGLRLPVFPSWNTRWHFEDKIAQTEMFRALDIPHPETWVFYDEASALAFARSTDYPKVLKLTSGVQSRNVMLLRDQQHAESVLKAVFRRGLHRLPRQTDKPHHEALRRLRRSLSALKGINPDLPDRRDYFHYGYALIQEFIPENTHDTRVAVIRDRAFAFRRRVRENDFRASGSGLIDWASDSIDPRMLSIAFELSEALDSQTIALDFVVDTDHTPLVIELTVTYASWALNEAPAYWKKDVNAPGDQHLKRIDQSPVSVETMLVDDYIDGIETAPL